MTEEIEPEENFDYKGIKGYNNYLGDYNDQENKFSNIDNNNKYNILSKTKDILNKNYIQNKENYCNCNCCLNNIDVNCDYNKDESERIEKMTSIYSEPYNPDEYEENQFNEYLKDLMLAEGQLEKIKIELTKCQDFNIENCFCLFEICPNDSDELYPEDIKEGLKSLNVFISDFELKLFFNRYDLLKKGFLNFSDIFDIFIPFTKEYRSISEKKQPNSCINCGCLHNFSNKTLSLLKNLLDTIIKYENKFNFMRRGFTTLNLKLKKLFGKIDTGKTGYFSHNDLEVYMKNNRIFTDNKELNLLFIRLDKNRNGKIDFKEIYDETHPVYF